MSPRCLPKAQDSGRRWTWALDVAAALEIVVPSLRRDKTRLVSALKVAAHGISRSLSHGT